MKSFGIYVKNGEIWISGKKKEGNGFSNTKFDFIFPAQIAWSRDNEAMNLKLCNIWALGIWVKKKYNLSRQISSIDLLTSILKAYSPLIAETTR